MYTVRDVFLFSYFVVTPQPWIQTVNANQVQFYLYKKKKVCWNWLYSLVTKKTNKLRTTIFQNSQNLRAIFTIFYSTIVVIVQRPGPEQLQPSTNQCVLVIKAVVIPDVILFSTFKHCWAVLTGTHWGASCCCIHFSCCLCAMRVHNSAHSHSNTMAL